ncbi:phosphatidate cytidylyltransferase [Leucothrix sargassi]|nr:phosphatidate cytidylyltransferase [Leucothrix sargassi]
MLKQRLITAIILAACTFLLVLMLAPKYFAALSLIAFMSIGGWEWARLLGLQEMQRAWAVIGLIVVGVFFHVSGLAWYAISAGVVWWVMILGLLVMYRQNSEFYASRPWLLSLSGLFVLISAWLAIVKLQAHDPQLVLYLIFLVASMDTGAYFVGKAVGKNKLAPELSPGKTLEGAKGGLAGALVFAFLGATYFGFSGASWLYFLLLSLFVAALSVAGDLFESLVKREAGAKDSGTILPGHGGILDRVDGLLAALPVFVLGLSVSIIEQGI